MLTSHKWWYVALGSFDNHLFGNYVEIIHQCQNHLEFDWFFFFFLFFFLGDLFLFFIARDEFDFALKKTLKLKVAAKNHTKKSTWVAKEAPLTKPKREAECELWGDAIGDY